MSAPNRATKCGPALAGALALLGVAVIAGAAHSWIVPVTLRPDWSKNTTARAPGNPSPDAGAHTGSVAARPQGVQTGDSATQAAAEPDDAHYIDLTTARQMFDEQGALFIDARPREEYEKSHIAGAVHLTAEAISSGRALSLVTELVENYGYEHPIVIY